MPFLHWALQPGPFVPRDQTTALLAEEGVAGLIRNMVLTDENSLRTCTPPAQLLPVEEVSTGGLVGTHAYASPIDGLAYGRVDSRDIVLYMGTKDQGYGLYSFAGWAQGWDLLLGSHSTADVDADLEPGDRPQFLTQFVNTPTGVIIIPQDYRAYRYDGENLYELGYATAPAPPTPYGPRGGFEDDGASSFQDTPNDLGYAHNGYNNNRAFGDCRIGTLEHPLSDSDATATSNPLGGVLVAGEWRAAVQWIDTWGDLSPQSGLSSPVTCSREDNLSKDRRRDPDERSTKLRFQIAWGDISPGPEKTEGRLLLHTRDLQNSGDPGLYVVRDYATEGRLGFATLPDNTTDMYPYNIPDSWLVLPALDVDAVPMFKLACLAFGRLWIANWSGGEGLIRPSMPGRFGTFLTNDNIIAPDAQGSEITGMHATSNGMLVFTNRSTFLVTMSDDGQRFRSTTLSTTVGCVSPNSIATMPNGLVLWLSRSGFFAWGGPLGTDGPIHLSRNQNDIHARTQEINPVWALRSCAAVDPASGEYRCWVPMGDSTRPNVCIVYDGGFRELDYITADAVCVTGGNYPLFLAAGDVTTIDTGNSDAQGSTTSVWVLDHEERGEYEAVPPTAVFESGWLRIKRTERHASPVEVDLWMRECGDKDAEVTIQIFRDWREGRPADTYSRKLREHSGDVIARFDVDLVGGTIYVRNSNTVQDIIWDDRRPFWGKVSLTIPSCETFKIRITGSGDWEIFGFSYAEADRTAGKVNYPQGRGDR